MDSQKEIAIDWFADACYANKLHVAEWLYVTFGLTNDDINYYRCIRDNLYKARFLYKLFNFTREDVERSDEECRDFIAAFDNWGDDIRARCCSLIISATYSRRWNIVGWLCMTFKTKQPYCPAYRDWKGDMLRPAALPQSRWSRAIHNTSWYESLRPMAIVAASLPFHVLADVLRRM